MYAISEHIPQSPTLGREHRWPSANQMHRASFNAISDVKASRILGILKEKNPRVSHLLDPYTVFCSFDRTLREATPTYYLHSLDGLTPDPEHMGIRPSQLISVHRANLAFVAGYQALRNEELWHIGIVQSTPSNLESLVCAPHVCIGEKNYAPVLQAHYGTPASEELIIIAADAARKKFSKPDERKQRALVHEGYEIVPFERPF